MSQQTPQKRVLFSRTLTLVMVGVLSVVTILYGGFTLHSQKVSAANITSNTLNFQARLENSTGSIVPDGLYNVQFKLYDGDTSGGTAGKGAGFAGTNLWTETYYDSNGVTAGNDNRVTIKNGYLTVNLGSQTAFPSTINWDQGLWLTMNIGGIAQTATPTWDGEMLGAGNTRLKLTAVPYALRAGSLAAYNSASDLTSTLSIVQPTVGSQVFQLADQGAAGTYTLCIQNSGCTASASSAILNQNSSAQTTANFWISGTGRADTALQAPSFDIGTSGALSFGTGTNATSISVGSTTTTGSLTLGQSTATQTISVGNATIAAGNTGTINIGTSSTSTGKTVISIGSANGSGASSVTLNAGTGGISIGNNAVANTITLGNTGAAGSIAQTVNIATNSSAGGTNTVAIGNSAATASTINIQGGTGASAVAISAGSAGTIKIGSTNVANTITIGNTGAAGSVAQTLNLATNSSAGGTNTVVIGNSAATASTINIQGGTGGSAVAISAGSGGTLAFGSTNVANTLNIGNTGAAGSVAQTLNIGTNSSAGGTNTVNIGNSAATASAISIQGGTGASAVAISAGSAGTIKIGSTNVANTITIGNTGAAGSVAQTVNIATNSSAGGTNTVVIGNSAATASTISIQGGTGASALALTTGSGGTLSVGNGGVAGTIQIGNTTGAVTQTINIGTNATGSSVSAVTVGSTIGTSSTLIQGGTGNVQIQSQGGTLGFGDNAVAQTLVIGNNTGGTSVGITSGTGGINLNGNVTVAAGQYISLVGGITSTRPASPTEGMLYYDTTTKGLIVYANGKWQADRSDSTILVGTSASGGTSSAVASKNPDAADFVNTSTTSAQTIINSALTALPSGGGTVYLMEGTYIIDGNISVPSNVTIIGSGASTILKMKNTLGSSLDMVVNSNTSTGNTRITIQNLKLDGNKSNNSNSSDGIHMSKIGSGTGASALPGLTLNAVSVENFTDDGLDVSTAANLSIDNSFFIGNTSNGMASTHLINSSITGDSFLGNGNVGISLNGNATGDTLIGNVINGNGSGGINAAAGSGAVNNNNTISGNTVTSNAGIGILLNGSGGGSITATVVSGNTVSANTTGIRLSSTSGDSVTGNTITTNSSDGINLLSANTNIINGNKIHDSGGSGGSDGINVTTSDNNSITNNDITDTAGTGAAHAIEIVSGTSNYLSGNHYSGTGATDISDAGTTTVYAGQLNSSNQLVNRASGGLSVQNSSGVNIFSGDYTNSQLVVGQSSSLNGKLAFANSTNANLVTIVSGTTTGTGYQLTLPTALGSSGDCLKDTTGTGVLGFGSCGAGGSSTLQQAYTASTGGTTPEIVLDTTRNGLTVRNATSDTISGNLLEIQNNAGTATFLGASNSAVTMQDASGNAALTFDSTNSILKVFENVSTPTNYASISYASGKAIFSASSGTTQIGSGTGSVTSNLTGSTDVFNFAKTYTAAANYTQNDFTIQRAVTGGTNTLTGSVLKIEDVSSATTASNIQPSVLLINQSNASATGFLLNAQSAGVTKLSVSNGGNLVVVGSTQANSFSSNTYDGSGALTVGGSSASSVTIGRSAITTALIGTVRLGPDSSNNMTISSTTGELTLNGNARHTRKITVAAEYAGASMTGDGTNNTGTMTSDNMTSTPYRNFYKWVTTQGTAQDYDIWVKVPIPSDFAALPSGQTICMDTYASATTANGVKVVIYDTSNTVIGTSFDLTPTSATTWQNKCTTSVTGGTIAADGTITLDIKLTAPATTGDIRIGDISFSYLSKW
jgi:parallel beta-helix repeat protein